MSRQKDLEKFKGFIPDDVKTLETRDRSEIPWQGSSDRDKRLCDPQGHKQKTATRKPKSITTAPPT